MGLLNGRSMSFIPVVQRAWLDALAPLGTDASKPSLEIAPVLISVFIQKSSTDENGKRHKNYYPMESVGIACSLLISSLH